MKMHCMTLLSVLLLTVGLKIPAIKADILMSLYLFERPIDNPGINEIKPEKKRTEMIFDSINLSEYFNQYPYLVFGHYYGDERNRNDKHPDTSTLKDIYTSHYNVLMENNELVASLFDLIVHGFVHAVVFPEVYYSPDGNKISSGLRKAKGKTGDEREFVPAWLIFCILLVLLFLLLIFSRKQVKRRSEKVLSEQKRLLEQLSVALNMAPNAIILMDIDGNFIW
ncbi:MAG: hypothetical protein ABIJ97_09305, partial [Bacteroidota bacterium]